MKAVVLRAPGELICDDIPIPDLTCDGLILRVMACGICGSDLRAYRHGLRSERQVQILGHEISGVVAQAGSDVQDYAVNDRLAVAADVSCQTCYYCKRGLPNLCENWQLIGLDFPGGMAEFMQLPAAILRRGIVNRIPDSLSDIHSILAEPLSSVLWAQQRLGVEPGEVVVVLGDGPIGALHVQVARLRGARPIIVGKEGKRLEMFRDGSLGTWHAFNNDSQDVVAEIHALTGGRGADVAIAAAPVKIVQAQAVQVVRKRGRVGLFGGLPKGDPITQLDGNRIHYGELSVLGNFSYHPEMHRVALDLLGRGLIHADKIITATFPFDRAQDAFESAMNGTELKVVLTP